jgi:hypothetical protein
LLQNGQPRRNTMVPKSFSRASLGCPVRLRNNTMPAALEEGGVLPWRELSMTWARLDAKITASNNDLRGGSRPALPPADRRGHRFLRERIAVSKKTRGVTPRGAKVCALGGRYRGQNETQLFGEGSLAVLCLVGNGAPPHCDFRRERRGSPHQIARYRMRFQKRLHIRVWRRSGQLLGSRPI